MIGELEEGIRYVETASSDSYAAAIYYLGTLVERNYVYEKMPEEAMSFYEDCANLGHEICQFHLATIYLGHSRFIRIQDHQLAFEYLSDAAAQGHIDAKY